LLEKDEEASYKIMVFIKVNLMSRLLDYRDSFIYSTRKLKAILYKITGRRSPYIKNFSEEISSLTKFFKEGLSGEQQKSLLTLSLEFWKISLNRKTPQVGLSPRIVKKWGIGFPPYKRSTTVTQSIFGSTPQVHDYGSKQNRDIVTWKHVFISLILFTLVLRVCEKMLI
jgi:hypothetical protein